MTIFGTAKWICHQYRPIFLGNQGEETSTAQLLRKEFTLTKAVQSAKLTITGLGYYIPYINGRRLTDSVLNPAFTDYTKTVMYQTYNIDNLVAGANCIAVSLGDGFYNATTRDVWNFINAAWRDNSKLILSLGITYSDGTADSIVSDTSFKGTQGPVVFNAIRNGTTYDARLEQPGWTSPGFDDSAWTRAEIVPAAPGVLKEQTHLPIRMMAEYPCTVNKISDTLRIYDAGVNTSGWAKIKLTAAAGTTIRMRYAERLDADGLLDNEQIKSFCLSGDFQTDVYIAKGHGREEFNGEFAYHGFRYIEVTCADGIPADFELVAQEVRSAMTEHGAFTCSDGTINAIQKATVQATKTNMHGLPTDCAHREKNGWTGDAQLSAEQALLNLNPMSLYRKWMDDFIDAQRPSGQLPGIIPTPGWGYSWGCGPAWDSAIVEIPYMQYLYCGDTEILSHMYEPIKKYIAYMDGMAENGICCFGLGDWCPPDSAAVHCDTALTDTAYYYYDTKRIAEIAGILGFAADAAFYASKAADIKAAFRNRFIKDIHSATLTVPHCQTAFACIVYQGLLEANEQAPFVDALEKQILADGRKTTSGILGAKYVYNVLCQFGKADLAFDMIATPEYPSLGNMIARGATTLWEDFQGGTSLNHHMFGDVSAVFYKYFAGLSPSTEGAGFQHTVFAPNFVEKLSHAQAWHESPHGKLGIAWRREADGIHLEITIPPACIGTLRLPAGYAAAPSQARLSAGRTTLIVRKASSPVQTNV